MRIVADSSALISFAILDRLDLLPLIFSNIHIPEAVFQEVSVSGKLYSQTLRLFASSRIQTVSNEVAVKLLSNDVDAGEAEVIVLALELGIEDVLIDDAKGRKVAQANGLHPIGSIGVLLQAKKAGFLNEIKPSLDQLISNRIRISQNLYHQAIELAGE